MVESNNLTKEIENPLGVKPVSKLIRTFAIPSIVSMLVGSLYNIVDQFLLVRRWES